MQQASYMHSIHVGQALENLQTPAAVKRHGRGPGIA